MENNPENRILLQDAVNFLAIREVPPDNIDVVAILGASDIENPQCAAEWYLSLKKVGNTPKIIINGGVGWNTPILIDKFIKFASKKNLDIRKLFETHQIHSKDYGIVVPEAYIFDYLLRFFLGDNYPEGDVYLDPYSTNTGENIKNLIDILVSKLLLNKSINLLLIETPHLQLRARQIFRKMIKEQKYPIKVFCWASFVPKIEENYHENVQLISREIFRLQKTIYGSLGENFIEDIDIPQEFLEILEKMNK